METTVRASGLPSTFPVLQATLSGRIFERTDEGVRGVPDAELWLDGAHSITDESGRYFLCNVVAETGSLVVNKLGYRRLDIQLPAGSSTFDIELKRE